MDDTEHEWEAELAWKALQMLEGLLTEFDASLHINEDCGATVISGRVRLPTSDSGANDFMSVEGVDLARTLMAWCDAAYAMNRRTRDANRAERR